MRNMAPFAVERDRTEQLPPPEVFPRIVTL